jgi:hypothetical protein
MSVTKPIATLRRRTREITTICEERDEPVLLATNGVGSLVAMSISHYDRLKAQSELFAKLRVAQKQSPRGAKGITHQQMIARMRKRLHG